jgi:ATP-binding protein involved in chromosome partitioning
MAETTESAPDDLSQRLKEQQKLSERMERVGRKILVLSGKGGVGKSTVAANLAMSLAMAGKTVGLLDVDLHGPSISHILGLVGRRLETTDTGRIAPIRVHENLWVVSVGLLLNHTDEAVIWRGPMKYGVIKQFLKDVEWGTLDYLVIDSPPGTGDEPLAVAQLLGQDAQAVIVTTPQDVAVADVRRSITFCRKLDLPIAGILENMSGLTCPHCGETIDLFKTGGGAKLAAETSVPFLGEIPIDPNIVASGDTGEPFVSAFAESPTTAAFTAAIQPILNPNHETQKNHSTSREMKNMKIAIPIAQGQLSLHFGHCEQFALVSVNDADKTVGGVEYFTPPPHEPGVLPRWLHEHGANVIIAGGMGQRAQGLFQQNGIEVVVGAAAASPEDIVQAYLAGTLESGDNVCDH